MTLVTKVTKPTQPVSEFSEFSEFTAEGASERAVSLYFETLNTADFQATAALFAADGVLYPPFDSAVMGRDAIAAYLDTEAKNMKFSPSRKAVEILETGDVQYQMAGKVQTSLFSVNVSWRIKLNSAAEILSVEIKLLAALEELLRLKN